MVGSTLGVYSVGLIIVSATKEFLAIEFKRTQDARSNYVERATAVAQEQYKSLLAGLQAVGQVKGWKLQQIVFVGGTCGSIHVESFCEETPSTTHADDDDAQRPPPLRCDATSDVRTALESRALVCPIYSFSKISNL
jgi:hypothetical protein